MSTIPGPSSQLKVSPAKRGRKRKVSLGGQTTTAPTNAFSPPAASTNAAGIEGGGGASDNDAPAGSPPPQEVLPPPAPPQPGVVVTSAAAAKKKARLDAAAAAAAASGVSQPKVYGYETEIAQMIYVFGEINDPPLETLRLIEDIVRSQVVELTSFHRLSTPSNLSSLSATSSNSTSTSSATSSTSLQIEDLIFLIRDDRVKVNRLRTYLSWKEVRKNAKKEGDTTGVAVAGGGGGGAGGGGQGGGGAGGGESGPGVGGEEEVDGATKTVKKQVVKLPWELLTPFNDLLRNLPSKSGAGQGQQEDEDEDDDELEAYEDNIQRLREHDVATRKMTKEQYVFYSECRQASFTFRKAKRFREFVNAAAYLDVKPNDDINDVLGFLCFEMVRTICIAALANRNRSMGIIKAPERTEGPTAEDAGEANGGQEGRGDGEGDAEVGEGEGDAEEAEDDGDEDILEELKEEEEEEDAPKRKKRKPPGRPGKGGKGSSGILNAPPNIPCDQHSLLPSHVRTAFSRMQRDQAMKKNAGLRGWRGGPMRMKIGLI